MNKKIIRVISFVMALMLAFGVMALAAEDVKKAVFTVGNAECTAGGTVDVDLSYKSEAKAVLVAVALEYDSSKLMLIGFTFDESLKNVINTTLSNCNTDESSVVVLFNEEQSYDGKLGTLHFKVRGGQEGELEVAGISNVKNKAMETVDSSLEKGIISVKPGESSEEIEEWPVKEDSEKKLTAKERAADSILLKINTNLAMAFGEMVEIDNTNANVVPYIVNGRTLVPLRFVSETLGAEVVWEDGWDYCIVKKNEKEIKITFGSADIEVGGEVITYDAPIQVVEGRTMVPIRFISETLGYDVYWNEPNKIVAISPVDNPWVKDRDAELSAINSMMVTLLLKRKL